MTRDIPPETFRSVNDQNFRNHTFLDISPTTKAPLAWEPSSIFHPTHLYHHSHPRQGSMAAPTFATALSNVRRLTSSNLAHQSKPAQLLVAIEQTISSQLASSSSSSSSSLTLPHSATAYFASLLQCLERACADEVQGGNEEDIAETENMGQGALIPATLYLLAIVVPETPTQVVLSKVSPLLECILPLYDTALEHPPALRSLLQITTSLLAFAPAGLLSSSPLLKKSWNYLLELNLDPRPKVRHLAQEGVRKVLTTPIPPKLTPGAHPYLPRAREWTMRILQEEASGANGAAASSKKKARFADGEDGEGKKGIWVVQGLRGWVAVWGEDVSCIWLPIDDEGSGVESSCALCF